MPMVRVWTANKVSPAATNPATSDYFRKAEVNTAILFYAYKHKNAKIKEKRIKV